MTYKEWCEAFTLLNSDIKKLLKKACALNKFKMKGKQKEYNLMLPETQVDLVYVRKVLDKLDSQSYWRKQYLDEDKWSKYKEGISGIFAYLDTLIPERAVK
jgi:hypothetical protein